MPLAPQTLAQAIAHAIHAHAYHSRKPKGAFRYWDGKTPYAVHPIWCATTLLAEPLLPEELRRDGALALLYHDVIEDTWLTLPPGTDPAVRRLTEELTFESFAEEKRLIWERSPEARLLKLYDKVSNLLDGVWMSAEKRASYAAYTQRLAKEALKRYGALNIVAISRSVCAGKSQE